MKDKKIAVLYGGLSKEREVSLKTGKAVYDALKKSKYRNVDLIDVDKNIATKLLREKPDVCFIALHGSYGEDGKIQGMLEMMGIAYTGSNVESSATCFDKVITKQILGYHNIITPDYYLPFKNEHKDFLKSVVKPAREGSTLGISIIDNEEDLKEAIKQAYQFDNKVLVEDFIEGKEITVSILFGEVLPAIWIKPKNGFYDYEAKYTKGMTEYIFDTGLSKSEIEMINKIALKTYEIMECEGAARVDFIYDGKKAWVLEVNTLPGMTETSLLPKSADKAGISFIRLVEKLIEGAVS
jgi:D-alanine-D-alanine ligase